MGANKENKLKELEALWYKKLRDSGFNDIENALDPYRPLNDWHSRKFCSDDSLVRQAKAKEYIGRVTLLVQHPDWQDICKGMVRHGNSALTLKLAQRILELHLDGFSEREIAREIKRSKNCVHLLIVKAREWMRIL